MGAADRGVGRVGVPMVRGIARATGLVVAVAGCRSPELPAPIVEEVDPLFAWSEVDEPITITGRNFYPVIAIDAWKGGADVDKSWSAWLVGPKEGVVIERALLGVGDGGRDPAQRDRRGRPAGGAVRSEGRVAGGQARPPRRRLHRQRRARGAHRPDPRGGVVHRRRARRDRHPAAQRRRRAGRAAVQGGDHRRLRRRAADPARRHLDRSGQPDQRQRLRRRPVGHPARWSRARRRSRSPPGAWAGCRCRSRRLDSEDRVAKDDEYIEFLSGEPAEVAIRLLDAPSGTGEPLVFTSGEELRVEAELIDVDGNPVARTEQIDFTTYCSRDALFNVVVAGPTRFSMSPKTACEGDRVLVPSGNLSGESVPFDVYPGPRRLVPRRARGRSRRSGIAGRVHRATARRSAERHDLARRSPVVRAVDRRIVRADAQLRAVRVAGLHGPADGGRRGSDDRGRGDLPPRGGDDRRGRAG